MRATNVNNHIASFTFRPRRSALVITRGMVAKGRICRRLSMSWPP